MAPDESCFDQLVAVLKEHKKLHYKSTAKTNKKLAKNEMLQREY